MAVLKKEEDLMCPHGEMGPAGEVRTISPLRQCSAWLCRVGGPAEYPMVHFCANLDMVCIYRSFCQLRSRCVKRQTLKIGSALSLCTVHTDLMDDTETKACLVQ